MKIGDKLECIESCNTLYTVGKLYEVECFDSYGHPCLRDNDGDLEANIGQPLNGGIWKFEVVT